MRFVGVTIAVALLAASGAANARNAPDAAVPETIVLPAEPAAATTTAAPSEGPAKAAETQEAERAAAPVRAKKRKPRRKPPSKMTGAKGWY